MSRGMMLSLPVCKMPVLFLPLRSSIPDKCGGVKGIGTEAEAMVLGTSVSHPCMLSMNLVSGPSQGE